MVRLQGAEFLSLTAQLWRVPERGRNCLACSVEKQIDPGGWPARPVTVCDQLLSTHPYWYLKKTTVLYQLPRYSRL